MKCSFCNGLGYVFVNDFNGQFDEVCPKCKGKKELDDDGNPMLTNKEYMKYCCMSDEELAKFLVALCDRAIQSRFGGVNFTTDVELVKEWLQKPHDVDFGAK